MVSILSNRMLLVLCDIHFLVCWLAGRRDDGRQEFPRKALSECSITPGEQFF